MSATGGKLVIVGATSLIAQNCARILVEKHFNHVVLIGRSRERLDNVGKDLAVRADRDDFTYSCEVISDGSDTVSVSEVIDSICSDDVPELVIIAQGSSLDRNTELQENLFRLKSSLLLNGISPVIYAQGFARYMEKKGSGHIVMIGSVAGDRGRASNYVYGAGKSLIDSFAEGLAHYFALKKLNVTVTVIKPGPTMTPMTVDLIGKTKLADVKDVAACVVRGIRKGKRVVYAPSKWRLIMFIIRNLPSFVFNKLNI
jgi:hypothetical protein